MAAYLESLQRLVEQFGQLDGVGRKSASRMAFSVLEMSPEDAQAFSDAILEAKRRIHLCPICQNLTDRELCPVCEDDTRDRGLICVVSDVRTVMAMEKVREYRGVYHVLHGVISPMNGITPEQLKVKELLARINEGGVRELMIATNPTVEGETTAMYLSHLVKPLGIKVTRLAYGIPVGANLEYADEATLYRAIQGRRDVDQDQRE